MALAGLGKEERCSEPMAKRDERTMPSLLSQTLKRYPNENKCENPKKRFVSNLGLALSTPKPKRLNLHPP